MTFMKWAVRVHKWIALIVGLQIVLWIAGGVVMSVIPIEIVRGEHKVAERQIGAFDPGEVISVNEAAARLGADRVTSAALGEFLGAPVWRIAAEDGAMHLVNAKTGAILSPLSADLARDAAESDLAIEGGVQRIEQLETPPSEYARPGPVWRIEFDDRDNTTIYVDPGTGEVTARRSKTWRFYDFFWKLHIMDYDDGADFNHPLLITAAGAAIFVALSGLILLIIKVRRSLLVWLNRRKSIKTIVAN